MCLFKPIPTEEARRLQSGGPDAYGRPPERASAGDAAPCRHCLRHTRRGAPMLILAHRPFPDLQPYAETGPIFLCAEPCEPWTGAGVPPVLTTSPSYLLRGYGPDDRIAYGTGAVVTREALVERSEALLEDPGLAYLHVRSASNNCFQCRVERG